MLQRCCDSRHIRLLMEKYRVADDLYVVPDFVSAAWEHILMRDVHSAKGKWVQVHFCATCCFPLTA